MGNESQLSETPWKSMPFVEQKMTVQAHASQPFKPDEEYSD